MKDKTLIVITGPTGVGKTEATLQIAEHYGIPIINADSRQIFAEIPIGTAAPTAEQQRRVKHYFVGNHHIEDYYSASLYEQDALKIIDDSESKVVLLSGGSMMYIDTVCKGIDDIPTILPSIREEMKRRLEAEGLQEMCNLLKKLDPEHWEIVDRNNHRRVIHALEVCLQTGKTYTSFRSDTIKDRPFNIIKIGLNRDRDELYERINQRVDLMIEDGLLEEARWLYEQAPTSQASKGIGYKELFPYFEGQISLEEAVDKLKQNTRRFAKRQLTWFRNRMSVTFYQVGNPDYKEQVMEDIRKFLDK